MGELHDAVIALLDALAHGIAVIRAQHSRRKKERLPVDPVQQTAETHVRKSLKKSEADVKEAYTRDLARYGPRFAAGDSTFSPTITAAVSSASCVKARSGDGVLADVSAAEARLAFSSILRRLNAAFLSIFDRFTKGRSTREDYREYPLEPLADLRSYLTMELFWEGVQYLLLLSVLTTQLTQRP